MRTDIHIGIFDLIIFLGIFQGLLLAWFFLRNAGARKPANLYQGLLLLSLSLTIFEELLNNTGTIVNVLHLSNFSEPLNLTIGPLIYLYVKRSMRQKGTGKTDWLHFILFFVYLIYMGFYFLQPEAAKYNSYIYSKQPGWSMLPVSSPFPEDPLGIRNYINGITVLVLVVYLAMTFNILWWKRTKKDRSVPVSREKLMELRTFAIHFAVLIGIFIGTKLAFSRDLGDYFVATYISLFFFITTYRVMRVSSYFEHNHSFLDVPMVKYSKSSLSEKRKKEILTMIEKEMQENRFFAGNLASLSSLAGRINESTHHVSQVINEKLNKSFFELIARYRVEEAKRLLVSQQGNSLTIEEIAEEVGYNSKSSFNTAFKKITGQTPSQFRTSQDITQANRSAR
ncbi:MAG: helix-turn-helix domain-containing protein [Bacteroidota bacterium]